MSERKEPFDPTSYGKKYIGWGGTIVYARPLGEKDGHENWVEFHDDKGLTDIVKKNTFEREYRLA